MVIRLRGFPPPVWVQSACRHRRRGLIVAPQSRLERRDSRCRSAKAPKELKCSALEPPAICDEAGADAPRLTLRDIGPLLFSLIVQGGAQPHLTIPYPRKRCQRRPKFRLSGYRRKGPTSDHRSEPGFHPCPMDHCEWTPTFDVHSPDPLHRNPIIGESSRSGRVLDDCPESAQPRARTVWVYCGDLGEAP